MIVSKRKSNHSLFDNTEEEYVWQEFRNGNKIAYAFIYEQYADRLYQYGMQMVRDQGLVEDTIQDLFITIWHTRKKLSQVRSIKGYLLVCLRREVLKRVKRKRKLISSDISTNLNSFLFSNSVQEQMIINQTASENKKRIQTILDSLSNRQREIIYLKFYENLSYKEIADTLGLDLKYTYNVASKAYLLIKQHFSPVTFLLLLLSYVL